MGIVNPEHLLDQAQRLTVALAAGPPRQADVRRAISASYYAVFHFILTRVADEFVGKTKRNEQRYALVYRSIDHRALKELCAETRKQTLSSKYQRHAPANGFGQNIQAFAGALVDLQEKRHAADYDPSIRVATSDAKLAISMAKSAIRRFERSTAKRQKTFLTLLVFPPR